MAKYKAFISYRKSNDTSADLVKKALVEEYGFSHGSIFLDKHDIGPEYFDTKLKTAVESSSCLVLIVTKDCFIPKEEGEDWYLEEIKTALDNGITIIPLLFDGIRSLKNKDILNQLSETFDEDEIERLTKAQAIPYDFDLSDATFKKLSDFINKTNNSTSSKLLGYTKGFLAILSVLAVAFALFVGIGFLWGYFSSGLDDEDILIENTYIEGNTAIFEFGGLEAKYDLDLDSVYIDLSDYKGELPQSNYEMFVHSCSAAGAMRLFNKNVSALKYLKFLKGGSKPSKMAMAGISIAACVGSFCGFSQGSKWGKTLKQQSEAIAMFPKLKNKSMWRPVFADNILLLMKYNKNNRIPLNLNSILNRSNSINVLDSINTITWIQPDSSVLIAHDAGLTKLSILCKYNNWEIGVNTPNELSNEVERSRSLPKTLVFIEVDSVSYEVKAIDLPEGMVGIYFNYPNQTTDIALAKDWYHDWKATKHNGGH